MIKIEIKDPKDFIGKIRNADSTLKDEIKKALESSILLLEKESKIRTPVDTGRLRSSYHTEVYPTKTELYPTVNYAVFVHEREYTKSGKKVRHITGEAKFMEKALEVSIDKIKDFFIEAVKRVL